MLYICCMGKKSEKSGTLYIRDVPQRTLERLKASAKAAGRSTSKEARQIIVNAMLPKITKTFDSGNGYVHTLHIPDPQTVPG